MDAGTDTTTPRRQKWRTLKFPLAVFVIAVAVWTVWTWPLPVFFSSGIPSSDRNLEKPCYRYMIPGDHLQMLYHLWLGADMFKGKTELFHNVYEFNTGDDAARRRIDPHFAPFAAVFGAVSLFANQCASRNATDLLSVIVTFLGVWALVRRYVREPRMALVGSLLGCVFPYRWITILAGSSAGPAMCLAPLVFLGIDMAVRDSNVRGGILAAAAIVLAYMSDLYVFFFSVLAVPLWGLVALAARGGIDVKDKRTVIRIVLAVMPIAVGVLLAYGISHYLHAGYQGTDVEQGVAHKMLVRNSPIVKGLVSHRNRGVSNHVFFGTCQMLFLLGGTMALIAAGVRRRDELRKPILLLGVLWLALVAMVGLALGTNGPFDGNLMAFARHFVPGYGMVRQPVKIYVLFPAIIGLASALSLMGWMELVRRARWTVILPVLLAAGVLIESRRHIQATICLLPDKQGAYAAVANDAETRNTKPRVLVLPLWPGDSHWTSLYEYCVSLYRIRMVNGYSAVRGFDYTDRVFRPLESINSGMLTDKQLALLREMKIDYVMIHEDAFPEKVSPFPVGHTLQQMLNHPRLSLLQREGSVWAFRILDEPRTVAESVDWKYLFPSRRAEMEAVTDGGGVVVRIRDASDNRALLVTGVCETVSAGYVPRVSGMMWHVRVRGEGIVKADVGTGDPGVHESVLVVKERFQGRDLGWHWQSVPVNMLTDYNRVTVTFAAATGNVALDSLFLGAGVWKSPKSGESISLSPAAFFHAGYTDSADGSVVLRMMYDPANVVFYGPRMPLSAGRYKITIESESALSSGGVLGNVVTTCGMEKTAEVPFVAPKTEFEMNHPLNLPWVLNLDYNRAADVRIKQVHVQAL